MIQMTTPEFERQIRDAEDEERAAMRADFVSFLRAIRPEPNVAIAALRTFDERTGLPPQTLFSLASDLGIGIRFASA